MFQHFRTVMWTSLDIMRHPCHMWRHQHFQFASIRDLASFKQAVGGKWYLESKTKQEQLARLGDRVPIIFPRGSWGLLYCRGFALVAERIAAAGVGLDSQQFLG